MSFDGAFITGHNLGGVATEHRGVQARPGRRCSVPESARLRRVVGIVSATICDRVDKITVNEAADTTFYDLPQRDPVGFGKPIDHPAPGDDGEGTASSARR